MRAGWLALELLASPPHPPNDVLDLRTGAVGALTQETLGLAHGLLAVLLVLGLVRELLRGPGQRRHYLAVVWRAFLVLLLLQGYAFLASSVVQTCTTLSRSLVPQESVTQLFEAHRAAVAASLGTDAGAATTDAPAVSSSSSGVGGILFDALLALLLLVGQAIQWVFAQLSRVLIAFFYAVGPLALVFHVPGLDVPGRWLRHLVTVSCWPVVSALLLHLSAALLTHARPAATGSGAVFRALASSLLLSALAVATPRVASALVGGVGNLLGTGVAAVASVVTGTAAGGAPGRAARAAAAGTRAAAAIGESFRPRPAGHRPSTRPGSRQAPP
jgi:hypothetical protein